MTRKQRTISRQGEIAGVGLHSGKQTRLRIEPAAEDAGVTFIRDDLPRSPRIPARAENLREMQRRTALIGERDADVHTVEHFLACCTGLGIDNLDVFLDGSECPGMDGSALPFLELLEELGPVSQAADRAVLQPAAPVSVKASGDATVVAMPAPGGLTTSYTLDYGHRYLDIQHFSLRVTPEAFRAQVAPARTFCLESEAEALRKLKLGLGATYENTLVVGEQGPIQNTLRFEDEFARHKTLDLLGDLFLLGADLQAHVIAYKSGHIANLRMVRALLEPARRRSSSLGPVQIRRILPHRYPFLLVDRVVEIDGFQRAVGIKNVSVNEPFFQGHYPAQPIMPGVLILEAMAQLAGILLLRKLELTGKVPVLLSIDRVKFRRAVVPGDQIRMEANTIRLASGRGRVRCRATVEGALVSEARLNFALTDSTSS